MCTFSLLYVRHDILRMSPLCVITGGDNYSGKIVAVCQLYSEVQDICVLETTSLKLCLQLQTICRLADGC